MALAAPKKIIIDTDPGIGRLSLSLSPISVCVYIYTRTYYFHFTLRPSAAVVGIAIIWQFSVAAGMWI